MPLLKSIKDKQSTKRNKADKEDQRLLSASARNAKEKEFFEQKKKREAERKAAQERIKKAQSAIASRNSSAGVGSSVNSGKGNSPVTRAAMNAPSESDDVNRAGDGGHNRASDSSGTNHTPDNSRDNGGSGFSAMVAAQAQAERAKKAAKANKTGGSWFTSLTKKNSPSEVPAASGILGKYLATVNSQQNSNELGGGLGSRTPQWQRPYGQRNEEERLYHQNREQENKNPTDNESTIDSAPNLFQGNYSGNNYDISSMPYGVEADKDDKETPTIGNNGCELVSTVMAIAEMGKYDDDNYYNHVLEARNYALGDNESGKIYKSDGGTSISFAQDFAEEYGLISYGTNSIEEAKYALENGGVLVVNVGSGDDDMFTSGSGHYITLTGINDDGTWQVNNPNRKGYDAYMDGNDSYTQEDIQEHLRDVTTRNNIVVIREEPLTFEDNIRIFRNQEPFTAKIP